MPTIKRKSNFFESEEGLEIEKSLRQMAENLEFNTASTYSANSSLHPDNRITFVEKHMTYLNTHPLINPREYLSNLRLMTRLR